MTWWRRVAAVGALLAGAALTAHAQVGGDRRPSQQRPPSGARGDTLRARSDSAAKDTLAKATFAPPDSVMQRLLNAPGYTVTQYQGETITFDALSRAIALTRKAIVQRDSELVKSDSAIRYSGTGSTIRVNSSAKGKNVFVTPGQAPIVSSGFATYNLANRRAVVSEVRTSLPQGGEVLQIYGDRVVVAFSKDSVKGGNDATYYLRDGTITACDDSIPDYYFRATEIKRTGSFVVARPAILYIGDVPVMWLPFLFQDVRGGRHSGLLAPNIGVSDIVRNSPSYRRHVQGLGYYWAISDYMDAQASVDWRSSAGESDFNDPGFTRYTTEFHYRWLERYVTGSLAASQTSQGSSRNTAVTWVHGEDFTRNSSLRLNLNYVTNALLQRSTTVNPYQLLSTISSSASYTQKVGSATMNFGATRSQSPGRSQVNQTFPVFDLTTAPISLASWLVWTPTVRYSSDQQTNLDQVAPTNLLLRTGKTAAGLDSIFADTLKGNAYHSSLAFNTPLEIFGYSLGNSFAIDSRRDDFPQLEIITDVNTGKQEPRVYQSTYSTTVDWNPTFSIPSLGRNRFNLTPSISLGNVEGSAFAIRNERTGGRWVTQSKRLMYSISASPTIYGLFGGFGPFTRIRHAISPSISYTYAPQAHVSDDFLAALGHSKVGANGDTTGYLGALRQSSLTFQLSTNVEAKTRSPNDSNPEAGDKLKLVSINFGALSYDFERARATHSAIRGLTTDAISSTITSDLLPGFNLGIAYSLFKGSTLSDSARFSPFLTSVTSGLSFSNTANPFAVLARLFGRAVPPSTPATDQLRSPPDDRYQRQIASQPVAGRSAQNAALIPTVGKGWQASFAFTAQRQRPVEGANVVNFDPAIRCQPFNTPALRLAYDQCVAREATNPSIETPVTSGLPGSTVFRVPNVTSLNSDLRFNVTEHWAASWTTSYDFEHRNFASQIVSLQRDLHDWRAIFGFTQASNGSFAFNFLISLKAEPELKFDYHKATYKNEGF